MAEHADRIAGGKAMADDLSRRRGRREHSPRDDRDRRHPPPEERSRRFLALMAVLGVGGVIVLVLAVVVAFSLRAPALRGEPDPRAPKVPSRPVVIDDWHDFAPAGEPFRVRAPGRMEADGPAARRRYRFVREGPQRAFYLIRIDTPAVRRTGAEFKAFAREEMKAVFDPARAASSSTKSVTDRGRTAVEFLADGGDAVFRGKAYALPLGEGTRTILVAAVVPPGDKAGEAFIDSFALTDGR